MVIVPGWLRMDGAVVWNDTVLSVYSDAAVRAPRAWCLYADSIAGGLSKYPDEGVSGVLSSPIFLSRRGAEREDEPDPDAHPELAERDEWPGTSEQRNRHYQEKRTRR